MSWGIGCVEGSRKVTQLRLKSLSRLERDYNRARTDVDGATEQEEEAVVNLAAFNTVAPCRLRRRRRHQPGIERGSRNEQDGNHQKYLRQRQQVPTSHRCT